MKLKTPKSKPSALSDYSLVPEELNLPLLWQVIYDEALKANHLLFSKSDLANFEIEGRSTLFNATSIDKDAVSSVMMKILASNDLSKMGKLIEELPFRQRRGVFLVYRRFVEAWRLNRKDRLN